MPPQSPHLMQGRGKYRHNTVAQVIPMVMGHNIHRPKIRIPRLNMNDLNNLNALVQVTIFLTLEMS